MADLTSPSVNEERASQPGHIYVETTARDQAQVYQGNVLLHPSPDHSNKYGQTYANDRAQIYQGASFTTHNHYRQGPDGQYCFEDATKLAVLKQQEEKEKKDKRRMIPWCNLFHSSGWTHDSGTSRQQCL